MRIAYISHGADFKGGAEFCYLETVEALNVTALLQRSVCSKMIF